DRGAICAFSAQKCGRKWLSALSFNGVSARCSAQCSGKHWGLLLWGERPFGLRDFRPGIQRCFNRASSENLAFATFARRLAYLSRVTRPSRISAFFARKAKVASVCHTVWGSTGVAVVKRSAFPVCATLEFI